MVIIGVAILAVYYFGQAQPNSMLFTSLGIMVVGLLAHILLNKFIPD